MVEFKTLGVAALLAATLLAGCAGDPAATADNPPDEVFDDLVVTASTGAIRGVVVSEAIVPIANASVALGGTDVVRQTNEAGAFTFSGLEPGTYFVKVSKPGYFEAQASTDVVAGVEEPPIVKVILAVDAENQPFTELLTWTGFFGCGLGTNAGGGIGFNPCAADALLCSEAGVCLLNTANTHQFPFGASRLPDLAQVEMSWEGSQPLGNDMNLGWHDEGTADFKGASGPSPLVVPATRDEILDAHDEDITGLLARVFPGSSQELTLTLQQRFEVFVTYFYGFVPREGWAFVTDGACTTPEGCA